MAVPVAIVSLLPFSALERLFGYGGLFLVVFIVAALKLRPDWGNLADGFVSHWQTGQDTLIYGYFAVG